MSETPAEYGDPIAPWVTADELAAPPTPAGIDADLIALAASLATSVLYKLSGSRYPGVRRAVLTVGPTGVDGGRSFLPTPFGPVSRLRETCGCCRGVLDPGLYPIVDVESIELADGTLVPDEQIEHNGRTIAVRRGAVSDPLAVNYACGPDGLYSLFPGGGSCGRAPVTVALLWGTPVPADAKAAALIYARELAKALAGDATCRLPGNVVAVARQGVSAALDPRAFLDKGRVGVPVTDAWLMAVNPNRLRQAPQVWWPGSPLSDVVVAEPTP